MTNGNSYKRFSDYYDFIYPAEKYESEGKFILTQVSDLIPNAKEMLDLGCGTASHSIFMVQNSSLESHCVDLSNDMLNTARAKLQVLGDDVSNKITLNQANVINYNSNEKFDFAISMFNVITYFANQEELNCFFSSLNKNLNGTGVAIFDFWYAPSVVLNPPIDSFISVDTDQFFIERWASVEVDSIFDSVKIEYRFQIMEKNSNAIETFSEIHNIRYYYLEDIRELLKNNGFDIMKVFNQDLKEGIQPTDKKCIVVAQKVGGATDDTIVGS